MSVLIHIGYPKTGTTWLQTCVFNNVQDTHFIGPDKSIVRHLSDKIKEPNLSQIEKVFFNTDKNIIYSDPELSGLISFDWNNGENSEIIAKRLKKLFTDAKILIIIRNQLDFLASGYAYYIRKGGTFKFKKYIEKIKNNESGFSLEYLKYHKLIEQYQSIFGQENVKVYLYEELQNDKKGFLKNLSESFNWEIDKLNIDFSKKNQRLRKGLLHFMRVFNYFTKKEVSEKSYIFNLPFIYSKLNNKYEYFNYYKCFGLPLKTSNVIKDDNLHFFKKYFKDSNINLCRFVDKELLKKYNYPL